MTKQNLKLKILLIIFISSIIYHPSSIAVYAQELDAKKAKRLESLILANPKDKDNISLLSELTEFYLSKHQYTQAIVFLRKLEKIKAPLCQLPVSFFIGHCRFNQLRYLEETQNWQEYFDLGNSYRQELFLETEKIVELCPGSKFALLAQSLNWLQHKNQGDDKAEGALKKLMEIVNNYSKQTDIDIEALREVADRLSSGEEKGLSKSAYALYANRLTQEETSADRLLSVAEGAVKDGNLSLAEVVYDRYIELAKNSLAKDNLSAELIAIARYFVTEGSKEGSDPQYAERIFGLLKEYCGMSYFTEELQYLRAYNLERLKDYKRAAEEYSILVGAFTQSIYVDEAEFKLGVIYTYILGEAKKGLDSWQRIIERNSSLEYSLEGLYHKSLISHYKGNVKEAAEGYAKILEIVAEKNSEDFEDLSRRVLERQKEIKEAKEIEYNLKTFLGIALQNQSNRNGSLLAVPSKASKNEEIKYASERLVFDTGCFSPEFTFLWSGDLGAVKPIPIEAEFVTTYKTKGTKVVNLVILTPAGSQDAAVEMMDINDR